MAKMVNKLQKLITALLLVIAAYGALVPLDAQALQAPPSILAKVRDLQKPPSISDLLSNAVQITFGVGRYANMNSPELSDVMSFCTCPSEQSPPSPNGSQNISSDCSYSNSNLLTTRIVGKVLTEVNKMVNGLSKKFYDGLVKSDQMILIISSALVLYFVIFGIMVSSGIMGIQAGDAMSRLIKIAVLLALLSPAGWTFFNDYFATLFSQGVMEMVNMFSNIAQTGAPGAVSSADAMNNSTVSFLDRPLRIIFSMKFMILMASIWTVGPFGIVVNVILFVCVLTFIWLVVSALYTFLKALVGIYIMLGLAPIFISMFLFEKTREIFNSWINQLVTFFLQPILVFAFLGFFVTLFTNSLKNVVDKTEYCFVPFMPLIGDFVRFSWFRPAVLFNEAGYAAGDNDEISNSVSWMDDNLITQDQIVSYARANQYASDILNLARAGRLTQPTLDVLKNELKFFGVSGNPPTPNPPPPVVSGAGGYSSTGQYLYAYKGGWNFQGPSEQYTYATGRYGVAPQKSNDFPINPNDVMLFMILTFLGWRYSNLVTKIAEQLGTGVSSSTSGEDVKHWFGQKLKMGDMYEATMNKASHFKTVGLANAVGLMANRKMAKATETFRPDLVDPHNARSSAYGKAGEEGAEGGDKSGNPDPATRRGNPTDREFGPRTKVDDQLNDDAYYNSVKSRAVKVRDMLKKEAALSELNDHDVINEMILSKLDNRTKLTSEQRKTIEAIDSELISRDKLDRMKRMQEARVNRKTEDYIRKMDELGLGENMEEGARNKAMKKVADELLNDELILQRINKKLQGSA